MVVAVVGNVSILGIDYRDHGDVWMLSYQQRSCCLMMRNLQYCYYCYCHQQIVDVVVAAVVVLASVG